MLVTCVCGLDSDLNDFAGSEGREQEPLCQHLPQAHRGAVERRQQPRTHLFLR